MIRFGVGWELSSRLDDFFWQTTRIGNGAVGKDTFSDPRNPTNDRNFGWLDWVLKFGSLGSWSLGFRSRI